MPPWSGDPGRHRPSPARGSQRVLCPTLMNPVAMQTLKAPGIRKRHHVTLSDYRICTVDAFGVRESSPTAEEFTLLGTPEEFPGVVPGGEVWISRHHFPREGVFLLAHALARLGARRRGLSEDEADQAGLDAEQHLREDL